ncbi:MAG: hypothetical protein H6900_05080 [Rhodobacter sp.]|uniref:HlyD family secretion protein n=1 Tax=Pararhodobacter sp. TaxID=2127056 RepID=UPI001DFEA4EF|nr:hypothetical protein [Pararhodobacter sp.]MCB1344797.1 hypothetical protein [Paracoccaceae bacterium]MCC0072643.1 hypothetical protein [Rhodobacter sp.]HPD93285.1 hypothetical protein [Pararhodobacter sp.]
MNGTEFDQGHVSSAQTSRRPPQIVIPELAPLPLPHVAQDPVRVVEPMSIVWQGVEMRTTHWSVHGFTLEAPIPRVLAPGVGRVFDLTVLIGSGATRIEMRVQARADGNDGPQQTSYVFVDLDRAQAEVLHRIVDHVVAHKAMSLTQLLNETEQTRVARVQTGTRMRNFRTGFQLSLAGLALAAAGAVTYNHLATVKARYGAVTASATAISVPVAGTLSQITVAPGQRLAVGDVLGYVQPSGGDPRAEGLADRRRALESERAELGSRRNAMAQLSTVAMQGLDADRARLTESVQLAERRLGIERATLASMRASGLPTAARQRERAAQEAAVLQAQSAVLDARSRLDALAQAAVLTPMGITQGDLRGTTPTLETVDLRIAALDAELAAMGGTGADQALGMPILSPCDCTVQEIARRPGEWAAPADTVAVLVGSESPTIHALILGETARGVSIGDSASVRLADGTSVTGHVARLTYSAHWPGYTGLQDNVFAADRYARVEITPDRPLHAPVGMVADVQVITSGLWASLRATVGV